MNSNTIKHLAEAETGRGYRDSYIHTACCTTVPANQPNRYTWDERQVTCPVCQSPIYSREYNDHPIHTL